MHRPLPTVYTVDLREELKNGNRSILSDRLQETDGGPVGEKGTDHAVFEPQGYARFCILPFLRCM